MILIIKRVVLLVVILLAGCSRLFPSLWSDLPAAELQQTLDESREAGGMIGVSAAIIDKDGELWLGVSGNSYPGNPVKPEMVFDMGSAGKNLAAALMLDLAEEGLIDLDHPLQDYIEPPPGVDGTIPIRMLLNHTSGLAMVTEHPDSPFRKRYELIDFERLWTIEELFTDLAGEPYFPPGEGWHYSQAGYQISTLIAEAVTGLSMAEAVQSRLLDPLEIHDMVLDMTQPLPEGVEMAHNWVDLKGYGIPEDVSDRSRNWIASIARMTYYTTAEDFARWGQALYSGQVLEPDSLEQMLDFVEITEYGNEPPIFDGYGLGVVEWKPEMLSGHYGYGHSGSIPGYRAFLAYLPEHQLTIAVLSNTDKEGELGDLINNLLEVVLGENGTQAEEAGLDLDPRNSLPENQAAVEAFIDQELFCDQQTAWEVVGGAGQWIDLSLDWVVADSPETAQEVWDFHEHRISVNGAEIPNLDQFQHSVRQYRVECGDESLNLYARGFSVYLPPLDPGEYEITWRSDVTGKFNNGFVEYQVGDYLEARATLLVSE